MIDTDGFFESFSRTLTNSANLRTPITVLMFAFFSVAVVLPSSIKAQSFEPTINDAINRMYDLGCLRPGPDGIRITNFGYQSYRTRLRDCQRKLRLRTTGELDEKTVLKMFPPGWDVIVNCSNNASEQEKWLCNAKLSEATGRKTTQAGSLFKTIQTVLKEGGCFQGTVSEYWSKSHFLAVQCYQDRIGAVTTGVLSIPQSKDLLEKKQEEVRSVTAENQRRNLEEGLEIVETAHGRYGLLGKGACRGFRIIDMDSSSDKIVHVIRSMDRKAPKGGCFDQDFLADFFAHRLFPGAKAITEYSVSNWDGRNFEALQRAELASVGFYELRELEPGWDMNKLAILVSRKDVPALRKVLPLKPRLTRHPEFSARSYARSNAELPDDASFTKLFRKRALLLVADVARVLPAAREKVAADREKLEASAAKASCQEANSRLLYCKNELNFGLEMETMCGGLQAGVFTSRAGKCASVAGLWCDFVTGRMYNSKAEGAANICAD